MKGKLKQKNKKKKGSELLQKYMVSVDEFIKSKSGAEEVEDDHDHGLRFVKKKSRKELRKEKRKMKKAKMKSHYEGKKILSLPLDEGESSGVTANKQQQQQQQKKMEKAKKEVSGKSSSAPPEKSDSSKTPASSKKGKKINKLQESRKKALLEANEDEDREIKKLERYLGLNKRKNKKSLPQSFVTDGLDYILGMLDSGSSAVGMYDDDDDMDMAKENFEKLNDSQLSDEDEEPGDAKASEGSEEDMGSSDENDLDEEEAEDDDDNKMVDDDEEEEEAEEDDDDEMVEEEEEEMEGESDAAESNDENEGEAEEDAETHSKSETVSAEIFVHHWRIFDMLYAV